VSVVVSGLDLEKTPDWFLIGLVMAADKCWPLFGSFLLPSIIVVKSFVVTFVVVDSKHVHSFLQRYEDLGYSLPIRLFCPGTVVGK